jgi:hypothetical protein
MRVTVPHAPVSRLPAESLFARLPPPVAKARRLARCKQKTAALANRPLLFDLFIFCRQKDRRSFAFFAFRLLPAVRHVARVQQQLHPIDHERNIAMTSNPVFIHLLHGRDDPGQDMTGWGFTGPILGPFEAVHFTYKDHIRCIADANAGTGLELGFHDDLLVHDGKFYGDFEICGGHGPAAESKATGLPPDPDGMNAARAEWAAAAIRHFRCTTGTDWEDALGDLLCDLMHFCDREGFDFDKKLDGARMHYQAETTEDGAA